jgi:hypothetical protein
MGSQTDIGFNTVVKMWFVQFMDELRWVLGSMHVRNEVRLKNVVVDGFTWPDPNARTSHGRFRFYDENRVATEGHGTFADSIAVTGPSPDAVSFVEFRNVEPIVKYNVKSMDWTIQIGDQKYVSKNLVGKISTRSMSKEPIVAVLEPCDVLHSSIVTLINCDLQSKIPSIVVRMSTNEVVGLGR